MENITKISNDINDFPIYSNIDKVMIDRMCLKMIDLLGNLSSVLHINTTEIIYQKDTLIEIFERIEKRRIYFHVFYKGCKMGELNEGALLCFWIAKLHPFYHPGIDTIKLNSKIAVCLFSNMILFYSKNNKQERKIPSHFVNDLYYSLLYRDISKESLMLLAESFIEKKSH
ncbi:MAG: hypothetical protein FWD22_00880 [Treponema sp.]|nr:hypothetical protein [Treponema sp.]